MKESYLPKEAPIFESCNWLELQTGRPWTLPQLLECGLMPWFWLDYQHGGDVIFNGRIEGYLAPVVFGGDIQRLSTDGREVLVNMTRTHGGEILKIDPPLRFSIDELRFLRKDLKALEAVNQAEALPINISTEVHKLQNRTYILDAEINTAKKNALDKNDHSSVFTELIKMAEKQNGCLIGVDEKSIKYMDGEEVKFFSKRNLRDRMARK